MTIDIDAAVGELRSLLDAATAASAEARRIGEMPCGAAPGSPEEDAIVDACRNADNAGRDAEDVVAKAARNALPAILAERARLKADLDEARANGEGFRKSMYALEKRVMALTTERDEAMATLYKERDYAQSIIDELGSILGCGEGEGVDDAAKRIVAARATALADLAKLREVVAKIAAMGTVCSECEDEDPPRRTVATHMHVWRGLAFHHCAKHAEDQRAAFAKAASKGCGLQPEVVPYNDDHPAIALALSALDAAKDGGW